jgi:hypothetical protein
MQTINHIENLQTFMEHTDYYVACPPSLEIVEEARADTVVFSPKDCRVVLGYQGTLSSGQRELYDLLCPIWCLCSTFTVSVGALAEELHTHPLAIDKRLQNLNSLGAIRGYSL